MEHLRKMSKTIDNIRNKKEVAYVLCYSRNVTTVLENTTCYPETTNLKANKANGEIQRS